MPLPDWTISTARLSRCRWLRRCATDADTAMLLHRWDAIGSLPDARRYGGFANRSTGQIPSIVSIRRWAGSKNWSRRW